MDWSILVPVIVAIIAAGSAYASQRSASKAAKQLKVEDAKADVEVNRIDMEKGAYDRARAFDTETIARQNKRIAELSREVRRLRDQVADLESRQCKVEHDHGAPEHKPYFYEPRDLEDDDMDYLEGSSHDTGL